MKQYPSIKVALSRLKAKTHAQQALNEHMALSYMTIWDEDTNTSMSHLCLYLVRRTSSRERIPLSEETVEGVQQALKELEVFLLLET